MMKNLEKALDDRGSEHTNIKKKPKLEEGVNNIPLGAKDTSASRKAVVDDNHGCSDHTKDTATKLTHLDKKGEMVIRIIIG